MKRFALFLSVIFALFAFVQGFDPCNSGDIVIQKNGNPQVIVDNVGLTFTQGGGFGTSASTLTDIDSGAVRGSLRMAAKGVRPACSSSTRGMLWQGADLQICVQINNDSDFPTFAWQNILTRGGASNGQANGYEIRDAWGLVFDAFPRPLAPWAVAKAICESLGGRLPTITELYRNNEASGFVSTLTESISTQLAAAPYLWTGTVGTTSGQFATVRLPDGSIGSLSENALSRFICVWNPTTAAGMSGRNCYGPPGKECQTVNLFFNMDSLSRPPLTFPQAIQECNAGLGTLPNLATLASAIVDSSVQIDPSVALWVNELGVRAGPERDVGAVITPASRPLNGDWSPASFAWSLPNVARRFYCIGKNPLLTVNPPSTSLNCNGGCYQIKPSLGPFFIDSSDRAAASYDQAQVTCVANSGLIPTFGRFSEAVRGGATGFTVPLWIANGILANAIGSATVQEYSQGALTSTVTNPLFWTIDSTSMNWTSPANDYPYRCIYKTTLSPTFKNCFTSSEGVWNGNDLSCLNTNPGNSNGNSNGGDFADQWGYTWDSDDRAPLTWPAAKALCESFSGRLPVTTELYRIRGNNPYNDAAGLTNRTTSGLWSSIVWTGGSRTTVRLTDGAANFLPETSASAFRCVWPPSPIGNTFVARRCNGPENAACFVSGNLQIDVRDRTPVSWASANSECVNRGGRLPTLEEISRLIQAGAPEGSAANLWTASPLSYNFNDGVTVVVNGRPSVALVSWTGVGAATYRWTGPHDDLTSTTVARPFRCVFSQEL